MSKRLTLFLVGAGLVALYFRNRNRDRKIALLAPAQPVGTPHTSVLVTTPVVPVVINPAGGYPIPQYTPNTLQALY